MELKNVLLRLGYETYDRDDANSLQIWFKFIGSKISVYTRNEKIVYAMVGIDEPFIFESSKDLQLAKNTFERNLKYLKKFLIEEKNVINYK